MVNLDMSVECVAVFCLTFDVLHIIAATAVSVDLVNESVCHTLVGGTQEPGQEMVVTITRQSIHKQPKFMYYC